MAPLRVLGIDPGTIVAGWAVLESPARGPVARRASGCWRLGARRPIPVRLASLSTALAAVIEEWRPRILALESAFFGRNARSALRLGEARGVVLEGAAAAGLEVVEISPALVKRRVGGSGAIGKRGMAVLVASQLGLVDSFDGSDESDALAVALCAILEHRVTGLLPGHNGAGLPPGAALQ